MAEGTSKKRTSKPRTTTTTTRKQGDGFSAQERQAMKDRAKELRAEARASKGRAAGERALLDTVAELPEPDRTIAERIHAIVTASAPGLAPKTWYGMPAYANADGKVVCFFTPASKFDERYATFGFNGTANLDQGNMWPTSFALQHLTAAEEKKIAALVKKAVR
jgi:uncharacterized protein YdhG (YjbR/CyaY superfamily)